MFCSVLAKHVNMKKITFLLASLFLVAGISSYAQTEKTKSKEDKTKVKEADGKTKVKDNKMKTKDAAGNKTKIKAPAPVLKSFTTDYPSITNATWSMNRGNWTATYDVNGMQTVTTYHANGKRVDTRTTYQVNQAPQAVLTYQQNNPGFTASRIIMISRPDMADIYEIRGSNGQTIYIDANGTVTTYTPMK
jgi:hypothetical protein